MKRRFISFLSAVVVAFMSFAQIPDNAIFSWVSPDGTVQEIGGTVVEVNGTDAAKPRVNYANGGYYTICLNGKKGNINDAAGETAATHALITLDQALQEGDSIYVTAYRNKGDESKKSSIYFLYENGTEVNDDTEYPDIAIEGQAPATHGYLVPAEAAGSKTIKLSRNSASTNLFITQFVIVRQAAEEEVKTDYTDAIVNADLSTTDAWNTEGTKGISGGVVKVGSGSTFDFSQTITLPAGQYKMTAQAAYRYSGAEQSEYDAILAGTETHYAKLYAETATKKYEVNVQNRWEGASETDYVAGNGSATVNNLFVPNSSAAVKTWFDNGKYVNELEFNVYEDGQVKIGIAKTENPEVGDYANIGAWTLIRLGDAVEEVPETPTSATALINFAADGNCTATSGTFGDISFATDKGTASNAPAYNAKSAELRVYRYTNLNFTSKDSVINKIVITCSGTGYMGGDAIEVTAGENAGTAVAVAAENVVKDETALTITITVDEANYVNLANLGSENVQLRIKSIEVTYAKATKIKVGAPDFSLAAGNLFAATSLELTAEEGATIYWSTNNVDFTEYTGALTIESTCTVYAYAEVDGTKSAVASAEYVMATTYDNIAALLAAEATSNGVPVIVKLDATVDSLAKNSVYLVEGTDTLLIYDYNIPADYVVGSVVMGQFAGLWKDYYGTLELCNVDYSGASHPYFADGDYLIVNAETGYYLGGGNDWGTHASLLGKPQFFTFARQSGNAYTLDSHQSNGGDSHFLGTGLYCDAAAANWTFTKNENGNYTINNGGNYLAGNGINKVIVTVTEVTAAAEWTIISKAEAFAALDAATVEAPVDATIYVVNPEFKRNAGGWTVTSADGTGTPSNYALGSNGNTANCAESYHSTNGFDFSQVLAGMKPGVYRLDGHAFYRNDGDNTGTFPYFYVNDQQSLFPELTGSENSMAAAYASFLNGSYAIVPIYFTVAEGDSIKVGTHGENTAFWNIWGELGLTYYGADASIAEVKASSVYAEYKAAIGKPMNAEVLATMEAAKTAYEAESSDDNLAAFTSAVAAATASVNAYAISKVAIDAMYALMESTNVYTAEAYATYSAKAEDFLAQYEAGTLTATVDNPAAIHGWHASVDYDDLLLSAFGVKDFDTDLYINTWSGEGETDGTEFKVPFFEYWTGDGESLGATTKTATVTGLTPGQYYSVEAWVRVRAKNGVLAANATGITLSAGDGEAVDVTEGEIVGDSQFSHAVYTAYGYADAEGNLTINFNVLEDNNISWLSFKNLKYAEAVESFTDFYTNPSGEEALESLGNIELFFFDLVENVVVSEEVQATLTTPTYEASVWTSLYVNDADPNNTFNYICFELEETYTEPGEYVLNIPAGLFTVEGAPNAETQVYFTVKAAAAGFEAEILGVTPAAGEVTELSEIIVQFSNDQVMPYSNIFLTDEAGTQYEFELDINHPDYTQAKFVAKEGAITAAGTYTLDCSQIDHMNMMTGALSHPFTGTYSWTIVASAGKKVVYDLNVEREAGLGYAAEDYTIATSELAALLGVESLGEATIWGVNPDGSYVADAMAAYDGWRAVDGTFAGWSSETAAVCVKLFAEEAAYLISICTHGDNGNDPVAGTQSTAVWALVAGVDTVVINTNITFVEPTIINIADFEVVSTIKVEHNESPGVAFSGNTASFDAAAVAAALGVTSLAEAEQYILNVTTGNLVANTTDGWRNSQGDATAWGSLDEGSVCVKINDPASGTIDYIGCYDATYEDGETYIAKWAFVHEGKAVVIEVVIEFYIAEGIDNLLNPDAPITVYTINGKAIQTTVGGVKSLEKGIYIINGMKVLVK